MRLIDADKLLEAIDNQDNWLGQMELAHMANINIYSLVNSMQTIEPTFGLFKEMLCSECDKRPQGNWIKETSGYYIYFRCSNPNCNNFVSNPTRFCSNCGACMIKEAKNVSE